MEAFSRILPLSNARFPNALRDSLLSTGVEIFEEDFSASYILRQPSQYTHNPTRAAIALTHGSRLVVVAMSAKKIDVPLNDTRWLDAVSITSDKPEKVIFKVQMGVLGPGTVGSSLEIRVNTRMAGAIVQAAETARSKTQANAVEPARQPPWTQQAYSAPPYAAASLSTGQKLRKPIEQSVGSGLARKPVTAAAK